MGSHVKDMFRLPLCLPQRLSGITCVTSVLNWYFCLVSCGWKEEPDRTHLWQTDDSAKHVVSQEKEHTGRDAGEKLQARSANMWDDSGRDWAQWQKSASEVPAHIDSL